jgi:hypothetical protein
MLMRFDPFRDARSLTSETFGAFPGCDAVGRVPTATGSCVRFDLRASIRQHRPVGRQERLS